MECPNCKKKLVKVFDRETEECIFLKCGCGYVQKIDEDIIIEFNISVKYQLLCSKEELEKIIKNELFLQEIINPANFEKLGETFTDVKLDDFHLFWDNKAEIIRS